ncbi:MAG: carboxypeptidase regulatory-like domain-containing protein [Planctomycetes bacterium]|nr:carboxypeptidase regulatory-like domain-containing protein [Planctomycetota bacterium]
MTGRTRLGPWLLLALFASVAVVTFWVLRVEPATPVGVAGRTADEPSAASSRDRAATTTVVDTFADASEERTRIGPEVEGDDDAARELELGVFDVAGQPLVDARVRVFDDTEVLGDAKSDARGVVHVRAAAGRGRVLVAARGSAPWLAEIDATAGQRRVDEPERATLYGRVLVDRAEPGVELEFELSSDRALFDAAEIPVAVRAALALDAREATRLSARCDAHGEFAFRGLTEPFAGRLGTPERFAIARVDAPGATQERSGVRLAQFVPRLTLELVALPMLVGRVVEADGTPVPRAQVEGWLVFAGAERGRGGRLVTSALEETRCDDAGRFSIAIELPRNFDARELRGADSLPAIERIGLDVRRSEGATRVEVEIAATSMASRWDVGDVALPPARRLEIIVRGPDQKPIEGAIVLAEDAKVKSDVNGSAKLAHVEDVESASVGKLGFRPQDVALEGDGPFEVVLQPTNRWTVAFVDATGAPIPKRRFVLTAAHALFLGDDPTRPARTHVESGATDSDRAFKLREGTGFVAHFHCDEDGRAVLSDVASPFTLRVTDGLGVTLEEREIALGAEEAREDRVQLAVRGGTFAGRVVDDFGASLAGASVRLNARALRASETQRTDAAGEFRFEDLQGGRVRLEIEREGFSPLAIDDYELVLDGEPIEFRLNQAGMLSLEVVDDLGNAVPTGDLRVRARQHPGLPVRRRGPNRFELRELPGDPVTAVIEIGGRTYEREVDARGGDTRVVVPRHGRVQITFVPAGTPLTGGEYRARVRSLEPGDRVSLNQQLRTQRGPIATTFDALLPGDYEVEVEWRAVSDRDGRTLRKLGAPKRFSVSAESPSRVEVRE